MFRDKKATPSGCRQLLILCSVRGIFVFKMRLQACLYLGLVTTGIHSASSKTFAQVGGLLPSPVRYFNQNGDQLALDSATQTTNTSQYDLSSGNINRQQEARFGIPVGYTATGTGYSSGSPTLYNPVKLDLGGILIGTVLGLGAVLILPKLLHVFSNPGYGHASGYGSGYGRNEGGPLSVVSEVMSRVDEVLAENNINSSACIQRALCSSVQPFNSAPSAINTIITAASKSSFVNFLMEGSRLEQAIEAGKKGKSCASAYPECPFSQDSVSSGIKALMESNKL